MNKRWIFSAILVGLLAPFSAEGETADAADLESWQQRVVDHARIMSQVKWKPVADGLRRCRDGTFKADSAYVGVPYSNGGWEGRLIGFDVFLKTFLAAVENPRSVLYTRNLRGQRRSSFAFYGMVCSVYTSYALQLAVQVISYYHRPPYREGIEPAPLQSAQGARVGDVLWLTGPGHRGHVEIVTQVTTAPDGTISRVRVEDSYPPTTRTIDYTATRFDEYLAKRKAVLYRITDHNAWRGENRAERFLFPNYAMDADPPPINRVLLLDLGDWVAYRKGQPVLFHVMDRDHRGVKALVIKREGNPIEQISLEGPGIVERTFAHSGDYTAHCTLKDGTASQACEFSICRIDSRPVTDPIVLGQPCEIEFHTENMKAIHVQVSGKGEPDSLWINDEHRRQGRVTIPADALSRAGKRRITVTGENRYGRLKNYHIIEVVKPE